MRAILVAALLTSALGITASPASAADSSSFAGGCVGILSTSGHETYVVSAVAVSSSEAGENPVTATVTCSWVANGSTRASWSFVASPVGTDVIQVLHTWTRPGDHIKVCTTVDYTSNGDATDTSCRDVDKTVNQALFDATAPLDPLVCPTLASLRPGIPGVVDIDSEGDVAVAGNGFWDCPPYGS